MPIPQVRRPYIRYFQDGGPDDGFQAWIQRFRDQAIVQLDNQGQQTTVEVFDHFLGANIRNVWRNITSANTTISLTERRGALNVAIAGTNTGGLDFNGSLITDVTLNPMVEARLKCSANTLRGIVIGLKNAAADNPGTNIIAFRSDGSVGTPYNWECVSDSGGTSSRVDTGNANNTAYWKFKIEIQGAVAPNAVLFSIDKEDGKGYLAVAAISANITTLGLQPQIYCNTVVGGSGDLFVDWYKLVPDTVNPP